MVTQAVGNRHRALSQSHERDTAYESQCQVLCLKYGAFTFPGQQDRKHRFLETSRPIQASARRLSGMGSMSL